MSGAFGWICRGARVVVADGKRGSIADIVDHGMSDLRTWRYSLSVDLDIGYSNLFTEQDVCREALDA